MKEEEIEKLVKAIADRASIMFLSGVTPTPSWWLDRMKELLEHVTHSHGNK